ncbi:MAG: hypothetical protein JO347_07805, partial [Candidatus Eremiobacteraeota bacterium]|nr:hypothetical protein [Candidatus Eremiobacteraeota bacterium]
DNRVAVDKRLAFRSNVSQSHQLASAPFDVRRNAVIGVSASIQTQRDGTVLIILSIDGERVLRVRDEGHAGGPIIQGAGRAGIFATNCEFYVRRFKISALPTP